MNTEQGSWAGSSEERNAQASSLGYGELPDRINCPVCKAGQEPNATCRRCGADLALFLQCLTSRSRAEQQYRAAIARGDQASDERMRAYLNWL